MKVGVTELERQLVSNVLLWRKRWPPQHKQKTTVYPSCHMLLDPLSSFAPQPPPPRFTSLWRVIDLPCETHATVLLSLPLSPLFTHFPTFHPCTSSLLLVLLSRPPPSLYPRTLTENDQPSLVWFDRGKFYLTFEGKFSLQQGSAHTRYYEAHSCKLWPSSLLPLSSFPSRLLHHHHPFITLTLAMLSSRLNPSPRARYSVQYLPLTSSDDDVHFHHVCTDSFPKDSSVFVYFTNHFSLYCHHFTCRVFDLGLSDDLWSCPKNTNCQHVWSTHAHLPFSVCLCLFLKTSSCAYSVKNRHI